MVFNKVKEIIARELHIEETKITPEANLEKDLGADSLDAVEVVMALEEEFDLSVDDDALQSIKTVQDLVDYIENHK